MLLSGFEINEAWCRKQCRASQVLLNSYKGFKISLPESTSLLKNFLLIIR